ncbi:hypothetical protein KP79_PYT11727 [Mizuhopecten yessoensis]|uniref:Uncharacterized protein n=1 Tax=Mizuhopecten yessoensis TaxID=6573 RepID=A0A210QSG3_MIZYE|nr:hypothetical protein KP79_PYT11727 [Mizuhopecten yessoensis]
MPYGISTTQYFTALASFLAAGIAGSSIVFHMYKPLEGIEKQVEEEKEKLREEFTKYCEKKAGK